VKLLSVALPTDALAGGCAATRESIGVGGGGTRGMGGVALAATGVPLSELDSAEVCRTGTVPLGGPETTGATAVDGALFM
jgi:hypothetical protein